MQSKVGKYAVIENAGYVYITSYDEQTGMYHGVYRTETNERKEISFGENEVLRYADEVCVDVTVE